MSRGEQHPRVSCPRRPKPDARSFCKVGQGRDAPKLDESSGRSARSGRKRRSTGAPARSLGRPLGQAQAHHSCSWRPLSRPFEGSFLEGVCISGIPMTGAWDHCPTPSGGRPLPTPPGKEGNERAVRREQSPPRRAPYLNLGPFLFGFLSGAEGRAGCPLRCGKWTFSSSHKSNPAILGPPPSLEMFTGDCVYSAVTARKRSDIITSDQSRRPAPRASQGPPLSPSHSCALFNPRAYVVGWSFFFFPPPRTLSYNLNY